MTVQQEKIVRITLPLLAFVPAVVLGVCLIFGDGSSQAFVVSSYYHFPALGVRALFEWMVGPVSGIAGAIIVGAAWDIVIAMYMVRVAEKIVAEDFSWKDFRGGVIVGVLPGALLGWGFWIKSFETLRLPTCLIAGALMAGIPLGVYMGSCWCKPRDD